jgi:hypothetical protein
LQQPFGLFPSAKNKQKFGGSRIGGIFFEAMVQVLFLLNAYRLRSLCFEPHFPETPRSKSQISLVFRAEAGEFRFVKFVNHRAKRARVDMECTFHVEDDEDDDEDDPIVSV